MNLINLRRMSFLLHNERSTPKRILQSKAFIRRLKDTHKKLPIIKKDLAKREAGFKGEQNVDYYLSHFQEKQIEIINDYKASSKR
jgi:hypothetical protein